VIRWLRDWRTLTALSGAVLVALLAVLVVTSITDRERALQVAKAATSNAQDERAILNRRVDQLLAQISQLQADSQANGEQLAVLRREVVLLQQQVRDLGGQPVVVDGGTSPTPAASRSSPRASPTPKSSPTQASPHPSPSPSRTCVPVVGKCITGGADVWRPEKAAEGHPPAL
jgi:hypothetical protein